MYVTQPKREAMSCPSHFTETHVTKLEDAFSKRQKPDEIQLHILAMECNLLFKDVDNWFKARRVKWIEDLVRNDINNNSDKKENSLVLHSKKVVNQPSHVINHTKKHSIGSKNKKLSRTSTKD